MLESLGLFDRLARLRDYVHTRRALDLQPDVTHPAWLQILRAKLEQHADRYRSTLPPVADGEEALDGTNPSAGLVFLPA